MANVTLTTGAAILKEAASLDEQLDSGVLSLLETEYEEAYVLEPPALAIDFY